MDLSKIPTSALQKELSKRPDLTTIPLEDLIDALKDRDEDELHVLDTDSHIKTIAINFLDARTAKYYLIINKHDRLAYEQSVKMKHELNSHFHPDLLLPHEDWLCPYCERRHDIYNG